CRLYADSSRIATHHPQREGNSGGPLTFINPTQNLRPTFYGRIKKKTNLVHFGLTLCAPSATA
ncbi:MAG: hypothetical protein UH625_07730, partial [Muribaculaceae bacterium]|nr:hypothetical protein [Muribaculaceae bacterium]